MRIAVLACTAGMALAACSSGTAKPKTAPATIPVTTATTATTVPATLTVVLDVTAGAGQHTGIGRDNDQPNSNCGVSGFTESTDTFAFMRPGAQVTLKTARGDVVGLATLSVGHLGTLTQVGPASFVFDCRWETVFNGVGASPFYTVAVDGNEVGTAPATDISDGRLFVRLHPPA